MFCPSIGIYFTVEIIAHGKEEVKLLGGMITHLVLRVGEVTFKQTFEPIEIM